MIIGRKGVDKDRFLDFAFENKENKEKSFKSSFDLQIRKCVLKEQNVKFKL